MNRQDALFTAGFVSLEVGVGLLSVPAAFIVGGSLIVLLCVCSRVKG